VDAAKNFGLDKKRYEVYDRNVRADVELFRKENVELQTQEELLSQEYQTLCGAMTVKFQEQECTMPQMRKFLELPDQSVRESAWRAAAERRLQDAERINEIFDEMLCLRRQIASNAGLDNYRDYKFRQYHRFDYTPDDCKNYYNAVENLVVPVLKRIYERRAKEMNLAKLRPWDINCDPKGRDALKPFETLDEYVSGIKQIFTRIDPELSEQFQEMINLNLLDLASRKGKAPGGYQEVLWEARKPFIFWSAVGINADLDTLLHEGGHAFHALACADDPLFPYRHYSLIAMHRRNFVKWLLCPWNCLQSHILMFSIMPKMPSVRSSICWSGQFISLQGWLCLIRFSTGYMKILVMTCLSVRSNG
jgi:oligoendopeptidase F